MIDYAVVSTDFVDKTCMHFEIGGRVESSHTPLHLSIAEKEIQEKTTTKKQAKREKVQRQLNETEEKQRSMKKTLIRKNPNTIQGSLQSFER